MSLINKMLRDLNARHASEVDSVLPEDVRSLPEIGIFARINRGHLLGLGVIALLASAGIAWLMMPSDGSKSALSPAPASVGGFVDTQQVVKPVTPLVDELPPLPTLASALPLAPPREKLKAAEPRVPVSPTAATAPPVKLRLDGMLSFAPQRPKEALVVGKKTEASPPVRLAAAGIGITLQKESRGAIARKDKSERSEKNESAVKTERKEMIEKIERGERGDENLRNGVHAYKQGRMNEAVIQFQGALRENPHHVPVRQALLGVFVEQQRLDEALVLLKDGLALMPGQTGWAVALARIQVERGRPGEAWETLQKYQTGAEQNAEYQGFAAVLLQHLRNPHEAVQRYKAALRLKPREGRWWYALGNALEADNQAAEALEAYKQAQAIGGLTPSMAEAVANKLR